MSANMRYVSALNLIINVYTDYMDVAASQCEQRNNCPSTNHSWEICRAGRCWDRTHPRTTSTTCWRHRKTSLLGAPCETSLLDEPCWVHIDDTPSLWRHCHLDTCNTWRPHCTLL